MVLEEGWIDHAYDSGQIEQVGNVALNDRRLNQAGTVGRSCIDQLGFDDIHDLVDDQSNTSTIFGIDDHVHQPLLVITGFNAERFGKSNKRQDFSAVLDHLLMVSPLDSVGRNLLKSRDLIDGQGKSAVRPDTQD